MILSLLSPAILLFLWSSILCYNWYYHTKQWLHIKYILEKVHISSFYWGSIVSEPCLGTDYYYHDWRVSLAWTARLTRMTGQSCSNVFSFKGFQLDNNRYGSLESLYSNIGKWSSVTRSELLCVMSVLKWQGNTQFVTENTEDWKTGDFSYWWNVDNSHSLQSPHYKVQSLSKYLKYFEDNTNL